MARTKLTDYVFTPVDSNYSNRGTIKVPGHIELNSLLVVINVTDGATIYSFGDPGKGAERYHAHLPLGQDTDFPYSLDGTCLFALEYDTSSMSADDELLIYYEDSRRGLTIRPFDYALDAVERIRVGNPQSLIDADFEYGLQESKWQNLGLNRNFPSFYELPGPPEDIDSIESDGASPYSLITITYQGTAPGIGTPVSVVGTDYPLADGIFIPTNGNGSTTLQYKAKGVVGTGLTLTPYTKIKKGGIYDQTGLLISSITGSAGGDTTIVTEGEHGLCPGSPILVFDTATGTQNWEGRFFVTRIVSGTEFIYAAGANTTAVSTTGLSIYPINDSFFTHRPFDGGVLMGTQLPIHGLEAKRQSKRYFRYQSGKGIQYATGFLMNPVIDIQNASTSGSDILIDTQIEHGLQKGAGVYIDGIDSSGYNGGYVVTGITSETRFSVTPTSLPGTSPAVLTGEPIVGITTWAGGVVRTGMFDDLNGMFWEYDGDEIYVVLRTSTKQTAGTVSVTTGITTVTGSNTKFTDQITVGQAIQIKGQRYIVSSIESDTVLNVNPRYRGLSATGIKITKLAETRVPQSQWNFDRCDGTGASGYKLKLFDPIVKMQMVGINYSWYGAGHIDYTIRGPQGEWIVAHRLANNNFNNEAYMRSGNLPAHYEVSNKSATAKLTAASTVGSATSLSLNNVMRFPDPLDSSVAPYYVKVTSNQSGEIRHELFSYTGVDRTNKTLTGISSAAAYTIFVGGQNRTFDAGTTQYTHPVGSGVELMNTSAALTVSHWGSSVIMDGEFTEDSGYLFSLKGTATLGSGADQTVLLFRGAPSVSDTLVGELGEREVINRSQIRLKSLQVINVNSRNAEVAGILNPSNATGITWSNANSTATGSINVYQPSFAQYNTTFTDDPVDGEIIFRYLTNDGVTTFDLSQIREIQSSILGGNNTYPDGPEVLCITIRNNSNNSGEFDFVLNWTEAQA